MPDPFWKQNSVWWVPVLILILSGAGWLIKEKLSRMKKPGVIIGQVESPPGKVKIYIEGKYMQDTSVYGWYRIEDVSPGIHEIQWSFKGYQPTVTRAVIVGGKENRVDLPKLELISKVNPIKKKPVEKKTTVNTNIHKWFAGSRFSGSVNMREKFGFIWKCSGGTCILEGPYGVGLNMAVCQALAARVGQLEYYYNDAGMAWTKTANSELLEQCNASAAVMKVRSQPTISQSISNKLDKLVQPVVDCFQKNDSNHPVFNGCIDWHSAVHATWAIIKYQNLTMSSTHQALLKSKLTKNGIEKEFQYIKNNSFFEMPYGRAWFLRLVVEYENVYGDDLLKEMGDYIANSIVEYYKDVEPNPTEGDYKNPSWALVNLNHYAKHRGNQSWEYFVNGKVLDYFVNYNVPCTDLVKSNTDGFIDICGNWAYLVGEVANLPNYSEWVANFIDVKKVLPVINTDNLYLKGLNFSRAWAYWNIYKYTGDEVYLEIFNEHFSTQFKLTSWWSGDDYKVTHWVAQFGIYAMAMALE